MRKTKITFFERSLLVAGAILYSFAPSSVFGASNSGVTYEGRILKPDGIPVQGANVQFRLQIRSPDSGDCLLYEEMQSVDMRNSSGRFSLTINDGSGVRTDSSGASLDRVFANRGLFALGVGACSSGTTYAPNESDGRKLVVHFKDETMSMFEPFPAVSINFVPFAFESKQVQGFGINSLVRVQNPDGTMGNVAPLSNVNYNDLLHLIAGISPNYVRASSGAGARVPVVSGSPLSAVQGSVWFDSVSGKLKVHDGTSVLEVGGPTGGGVTEVTAGSGLTTSPIAGITTTGSIAIAVGGVVTNMLADGSVVMEKIGEGQVTDVKLAVNSVVETKIMDGAVTSAKIRDGAVGTIDLANAAVTYSKIQNVTDRKLLGRSAGSVGAPHEIDIGSGLTLSAGSLSLTDTTDNDGLGALPCGDKQVPYHDGTTWTCRTAVSTNTNDTLVLRDATGNFASNGATFNSVVFKNAGSHVAMSSPLAANYNLVLPGTAGSAGQVLSTNGAGILEWINQDNLGNHTAIQAINLNGNWLTGDGISGKGLFVGSDGNISLRRTTAGLLSVSMVNTHASQAGHDIAGFVFNGVGGGGIVRASSSISSVLDGSKGSNLLPGRLVFSTAGRDPADIDLHERMRIDSLGRVGIGTGVSAGPKLALDVVGSSRFVGPTVSVNIADQADPANPDPSLTVGGELSFDPSVKSYKYFDGDSWKLLGTGTITYAPSLWSKMGSDLYYTDPSNPSVKVGINTADPSYNLDIAGDGSVNLKELYVGGARVSALLAWDAAAGNRLNTNRVVGLGVNADPAFRLNTTTINATAITASSLAASGSITTGAFMRANSYYVGATDITDMAMAWETSSGNISRMSGNVGIGTTSPSQKLTVAGNIAPNVTNVHDLGTSSFLFRDAYVTNGVTTTSDVRKKTNIQDSDLGLEFIKDLRPVSYYWKEGDNSLHYGVIAQETKRALSQAKARSGRESEVKNVIVIHDEKSDAYGVRYTELIAPIIKAIQELYGEISGIKIGYEGHRREIASLNADKAEAHAKMVKLEDEYRKLKSAHMTQTKQLEEMESRLDRIERLYRSR